MDGLVVKVKTTDGVEKSYKLTPRIIVAFEQNRIRIPNYSELINELSGYAVDILTSGKYAYNAEAGHDDLVCSLFLAYYCYKNATKIYEIQTINLF